MTIRKTDAGMAHVPANGKGRDPANQKRDLKTRLHSIKSLIVLLISCADPVGLAVVLTMVLILAWRAWA